MLPSSVDPNSTLRISGLETENPLLKINHTAYQGEWTNLNGSELIFNENGEFVAKSAYRLNLTAGTLVPKGKDEDAEGPSTTKRYSLLQSALARIDAQNSGKKD
ncbi:unnamed protein product [Kuraishia capsulata CBS 1993]|uniref:Transcription factor TFIIIC triple barrel domain-containing protein n=1 Tax=Kuraishia capsulata CBS 1993 TaxID=1382522 RepID=W6MRR5_9ASCO|nr:uncharacterized protein KUCA_T00005035001 [Kuraishia capsulata CBS 1993]CDK29048.1 unnamed protein product [Kuraishia capsulata CBS 1993]